jgi:trehalose/maltose hydrolase-like predicted phosphorylase
MAAEMIGADLLSIEPWRVDERELHVDLLGHTESIFALSNGRMACARTSRRASRPVRRART